MILTGSTEYAIRAVIHLALLPSGCLAGAQEISREENIPTPFLSKILRKLGRHRLVRSFKGQRGGYELALPASQITLQDLVDATNGDQLEGRCALGLHHCDEANPCALHDQWKTIRAQFQAVLTQTTIADLARAATVRKEGAN